MAESRTPAGRKRKLDLPDDENGAGAASPGALSGEIVDAALSFLISRGEQRSGQDFLEALVVFLGDTLGVSHAFCAKLVEDDVPAVRTVALYAQGAIVPNIRYELSGTPCADVVGKALCFHDRGLRDLYPDHVELADMGAESYAGVPLFTATGTPIGLLAVIDNKPMENPAAVRGLLQIVGTNAALELERSAFEQQLRDSEARFRDVAEATSEWFWETDEHLRFTYFSERTQELGGFDPSLYVGRSRWDISAEVMDDPKWQQHLDDLKNHRPFRGFEYEFRTSTGEILAANISGRPLFDDDGNFKGYRGAGTNVTERLRTERALHDSERRFHDFAEVSSDWFWETDTDHRFSYFSPRNREVTGLEPSRYIGRARRDIIAPGVDEDALRAHLDDLDHRRPFRDFRYDLLREDGSRLTISVSGKPIFDRNGAFIGYRGTGTDVTREVEIERERDNERKLLQIVLDNLPFPITLNDSAGLYLFANKAFEGWYGVGAADVLGRTASEVLALEPDELSRRKEMEHRAIVTEQVQNHEVTKKLADGEPHHLVVTKFPVRDREGRVTGFATISTDITSRKQHEIELQDMNQRLIAASRAKSEFLAHMSHELRTPLNSIIGFSQIIREATFGLDCADRYREYAGDIHVSARHLLELITDILDIAKIEAGEITLEEQTVDPRDVINSSLRLVAQQLNSKRHMPEIEITDPNVRLLADPRLLRQILINLLSNASKFTPANGAITVRVSRADDDGVLIVVADKGVGMSAAGIERALEPFGQVRHSPDVAHGGTHGGTGLGLPLAMKFAELHGGRLLVESAAGDGTAVTVAFPPERTIIDA